MASLPVLIPKTFPLFRCPGEGCFVKKGQIGLGRQNWTLWGPLIVYCVLCTYVYTILDDPAGGVEKFQVLFLDDPRLHVTTT